MAIMTINEDDRWRFQSVFDGFNYADWVDSLDWPEGWTPTGLKGKATLIVQVPTREDYIRTVMNAAHIVKLCYWEKITVIHQGTKAFLQIPLKREEIQHANY